MDEHSHQIYDKWFKKTIAEELTPQGDLLPPWLRYPEIQHHSIGWRMGYGESYIMAWDKWAESLSRDDLVKYFKKYFPIPVEWLDWVASRCGFKDIAKDMFSGKGEFTGIHWLEQQGLANFSEFKKWYGSNWKISKK